MVRCLSTPATRGTTLCRGFWAVRGPMRRRGRTSRVSLLVLGGLTKGDLRMRFLPALLLFFPLVHAEAVYSGFSLIPHIADGGGIQMEFTLTNLDDTPST